MQYLEETDMFVILIVVLLQAYMYVKTHQILHFKNVQFIVCHVTSIE